MFEILMFLFENYIGHSGALLKVDNEAAVNELEKMGFDRYDITRALQWLEDLTQFQAAVTSGPALTTLALRHYLPEEIERLGVDGYGMLLYLEQIGVLDPITREIVIDRVMALDARDIGLGRIKWVVLLALFNQPDKKTALLLMQDMVLADVFDTLH